MLNQCKGNIIEDSYIMCHSIGAAEQKVLSSKISCGMQRADEYNSCSVAMGSKNE